jgi:hypothetical protein
VTLLIGLIRVRDDKYIDEIRSKFEQFMIDIIEHLTASYSKSNNTEKSSKTVSSMPSASGSFSLWFRSTSRLITSLEQGFNCLRNFSHLIDDVLSKHEQIHTSSMTSLLRNIHDTIQDRLIAIFNQESTRLNVSFESLSLSEYTQLTKLIEGYILNANHNDDKYTSRSLKTFLQGQTSKFLTHFHTERKQSVATTLENEQWKQVAYFYRERSGSISDETCFLLCRTLREGAENYFLIELRL